MRDYAEIAHNLRCCEVDVPCDDCTYRNDIEKCASLEGQAADAIEELLAAVPKWISVEERLPEIDERVLACVGIPGELSVWDGVRWNGEEWEAEEEAAYDYWTTIDDPVTHWMPLPKAPKEVE